MNTPKQDGGDGSIGASAPRSPLEQTVMGVPPPPPPAALEVLPAPAHEAASPDPTGPAVIVATPTLIAGPPVAAPSSTTPPVPAVAEAAIVPTATIAAAPSAAGAGVATPSASTPGYETSSPAAPKLVAPPRTSSSPGAGELAGLPLPSPTIPVAPVIAVAPSAPGGPLPVEAQPGQTLRVEPSTGTPPRAAPPLAEARPPRPEPERQNAREQTALSSDYLRDARAVALEHGPPARSAHDSLAALALASTERAPLGDVASAIAAASNAGDTHRSIAPGFEPSPSPTPASPEPASTRSRGFEPVPVVRAPLAESLSSALGPLGELGGGRHLLPPSRPLPLPLPQPRPPREGGGRWLLLAAVALATVGIVSLGGRLWHRYRAHVARERAIASMPASAPRSDLPSASSATSASHALLANRPAPDPRDDGRVRVISATGSAPAGVSEPGASASPESQLAATAGRHVLSGNFAEALPLYRQLERGWPENTSYAAMARLLEQKVGSRNDTRTVAPAVAAPSKEP